MGKCPICGSELIWQNDFSCDDVYGDGDQEGIVRYLTCSNEECKAEIRVTFNHERN